MKTQRRQNDAGTGIWRLTALHWRRGVSGAPAASTVISTVWLGPPLTHTTQPTTPSHMASHLLHDPTLTHTWPTTHAYNPPHNSQPAQITTHSHIQHTHIDSPQPRTLLLPYFTDVESEAHRITSCSLSGLLGPDPRSSHSCSGTFSMHPMRMDVNPLTVLTLGSSWLVQ